MTSDRKAPPDEPDSRRLRPTVMPPPAKKARAVDGAPAATSASQVSSAPGIVPRVTTPTAMPGVKRSRVEVDPSALRRLVPGVSSDIAGRAVKQLGTVAIEGASDRVAVLWGHRLQQDYSDLVSETLEMSRDDTLMKATGYVNRMTGILASIDLQAVLDASSGVPGLGRYLKKLNVTVDTPEELEDARRELDQLVRLMGDSLEPLLALKDRLHNLSRRIDDTGLEVEAAALGAEYLSREFAVKRPDLAARFLERGMSLTQTVAQIRSSERLRGAQTDQPLALIAAIQNVALVTVPAWLGTLSALTAITGTARKPTRTEAGEIEYRLRTILQNLKV